MSDNGGQTQRASTGGQRVRASLDLADIVASVALVLFPRQELSRRRLQHVVEYAFQPGLSVADARRMEAKLAELVARPEWASKCAVVREISDVRGQRIEALTPIAPQFYVAGEALVGPFASEHDAVEFSRSAQHPDLAADVLKHRQVWLCDLFELGELLAD